MNTHRTRGIIQTGVPTITKAAAIIIAFAFATFIQLGAPRVTCAQQGPEDTLLVWAGDEAHVAPDFLAVVGLDPAAADYGKVIKTRHYHFAATREGRS